MPKPRHGILEDIDFVLGEVLNQRAARISRAESDVDQLNLDPNRHLAQTDARRDEEQPENQVAHESTPAWAPPGGCETFMGMTRSHRIGNDSGEKIKGTGNPGLATR